MILVDTSVWVEVFRANRPFDLDAGVGMDNIVTCLPVVQEILQGFRDEPAFRRARDAVMAFPIVESPMTSEVFLHAADLYRACRRQGLTVRSSVDCQIAACAIRHDLELLHRDRDFAAIAQVSHLRERLV